MSMRFLSSITARAERATGLPGRFIIPVLVAGLSLPVALVGMYWDIGLHIDHGRDANPITVQHMLIVIGLQGIVIAALLHAFMPGPSAPRGELRLVGGRARLAPGGLQLLLCGSIALLGFPLDALWHSLFGEDVTLWGPTHLFMIGGAGFSTLGVWMLVREGSELGKPTRRMRGAQLRDAGALVIGLSTFQAEFDFGVPQFQLLYQPILIAFAGAVALVAARSLLGPGGALRALVIFIVIRGALALFVGEAIGYTTPHFPLYIVEALVVEGAALVAWKRPLRFALLAGAGIGTIGVAAEWAWSHIWMRHEWTLSMLPEVAVLAPLAAIGGALIGARIGQSLAAPGGERAGLPKLPGIAVAAGGLAVLVALAFPLPRTGGDGTRASVVPTPAGDGTVNLAVTVQQRAAAKRSEWFEALSWQGGGKLHTTALREVAPGRYETVAPVPADGRWKTLVRLARGPHLMATPVYLPREPLSGRAGVPLERHAGPMTSDTYQLQREATGGPAWLTTLAYAILGGIVAAWIALTAWNLRRIEPPTAAPDGAPAAKAPAPPRRLAHA
jgi:hypothetical protein